MPHPVKTLACGLIALLASAPAQAETESASLDVSAIVPSYCLLGDSPAIGIGNVDGSRATTMTASATIEITCAAGVPYRITLGDGSPHSLKPATPNGGQPIPYAPRLRSAPAATDGGTVERLGTGAPDPVTVQATITVLGNEVAGRYDDTLTVTVDW